MKIEKEIIQIQFAALKHEVNIQPFSHDFVHAFCL